MRRIAGAALLLAAVCARGDPLGDLAFGHGIAFFHELKYPPGFTHLDYLNPDAPKGGTLVQATQAAFDTLAQGGVGPPSGFSAFPDGWWHDPAKAARIRVAN